MNSRLSSPVSPKSKSTGYANSKSLSGMESQLPSRHSKFQNFPKSRVGPIRKQFFCPCENALCGSWWLFLISARYMLVTPEFFRFLVVGDCHAVALSPFVPAPPSLAINITALLPVFYAISRILQDIKRLHKILFLCEDIIRIIGRDGKYTNSIWCQDLWYPGQVHLALDPVMMSFDFWLPNSSEYF